MPTRQTRIEFHGDLACSQQQVDTGVRMPRAFGKPVVRGARIACAVEQTGLRQMQCFAIGMAAQGGIEMFAGRIDFRGAHPDQLSEIALRLEVSRKQR